MNKIYRIPGNLNADFGFYGCYSLANLASILFVGFLAFFVIMSTGNVYFIAIPVVYSVLIFKLNNYSVFYWCKAAIFFLLADISKKHIYTLLERNEQLWK